MIDDRDMLRRFHLLNGDKAYIIECPLCKHQIDISEEHCYCIRLYFGYTPPLGLYEKTINGVCEECVKHLKSYRLISAELI